MNSALSPKARSIAINLLYFAHGDGEVRDKGVFGLARTMRDDVAPARRAAKVDRGDRLGDGADLVELDEDRVRRLPPDPGLAVWDIGDIGIGADDLDAVAQRRRMRGEAVPVVLGQAVLDRDDRETPDPFGVERAQLGA